MESLKKALRDPSIEYRNEVRWWLAEGLHTDRTLRNDIRMLDEAGFGGAEFLAMDEFGADHKRYAWGSEEFTHDTHVIIDETTRRGMAASMTSGTNWSNANLPTIKPDDRAAAKELNYVAETVPGGTEYDGELKKAEIKMPNVHEQTLIAVVAAKRVRTEGDKTILEKDGVVLTDLVKDGRLTWTAPEGADWELFTFWMHGTGQTASPSFAVNYTINYIDPYGTQALIDYWNRVILTPQLRENILKNGRVQMYMDSLELSTFTKGGQFWGYHFIDEFRARRGYDLTPFLPLILKKRGMMESANTQYRYGCDDALFTEKLKNDLYQTMTDMYMVNVLRPIQEWLHSVGMGVRAEISYGLPFEISQPGKYVDGVETESLEFCSQIDSYRGLAGTAHIYGRLFSSETGATLLNYRMPLDFYQQIIFTQFAAGVARTVLHGYASICGSEKATQWPGHEGMWPIFSERFGCRQPAWQHYRDWNLMMARYQYLLRRGKPRMDLGILRLDYAFNNMVFGGGDERDMYENRLMRANEGLYWQDTSLQNAGYTYDYFAPQLLGDVEFENGEIAFGGPGYRALVIYQEALPIDAARRILAWAEKGLKVLLVNGVSEILATAGAGGMPPAFVKRHAKAADMTPYNDGKDEELRGVIARLKALPTVREVEGAENAMAALRELGVYPRAALPKANRNILPFVREDGDKTFVFLYNKQYTEKQSVEFTVAVSGEGAPWQIDCWTGEVTRLGAFSFAEGRTAVKLSLRGGEATMLVIDRADRPDSHVEETDACFCEVRGSSTVIGAFRSGEYTALFPCGKEKKVRIDVPDPVELPRWDLSVEDWNEGDRVDVTEDRGLGYVTREVYFETRKTVLDAGNVELKPWKDIPAVGEDVSGVGYYTASFTLPDGFDPGRHGAVLDLGSTCGCTAAVYVNGEKAPGIDFDDPRVEITGLVKSGRNEIRVEVSSTLNNRLRQRGYYASLPMRFMQLMSENTSFGEMGGGDGGENPMGAMFAGLTQCEAQDYGMVGKARVSFYAVAEV